MFLDKNHFLLHCFFDKYIDSSTANDVISPLNDFVSFGNNLLNINNYEELIKKSMVLSLNYERWKTHVFHNIEQTHPYTNNDFDSTQIEKYQASDIIQYIKKYFKDRLIPIGTSTHHMGLIFNNDNIIITNSGSGLEYHNLKENTIINSLQTNTFTNYKNPLREVVIILKYNEEYFDEMLHYLLLYYKDKNKLIHHVYAIIFRYYYLYKILISITNKVQILSFIQNFINDTLAGQEPLKPYLKNMHSIRMTSIIKYYNNNEQICSFENSTREYTLISFFIDYLFYTYEIKEGYIQFNRNNFYIKNDNAFDHIKTILEIKSFYILESYTKDDYFIESQYSGSCTFYGSFIGFVYIKHKHNFILKYEEELNYIKYNILNDIIENFDNYAKNNKNLMILKLLIDKNTVITGDENIIRLINELKNKCEYYTIDKIDRNNTVDVINTYFEYKSQPVNDIFDLLDFINNNINYIEHDTRLFEKNIMLTIINMGDAIYSINDSDQEELINKIKIIIGNATTIYSKNNKYKNLLIIIIYIILKIIDGKNYFFNIDELNKIYYKYYYINGNTVVEDIQLSLINDAFIKLINLFYRYQFLFLCERNIYFVEFITLSFNNNHFSDVNAQRGSNQTNNYVYYAEKDFMVNPFIIQIFVLIKRMYKCNEGFLYETIEVNGIDLLIQGVSHTYINASETDLRYRLEYTYADKKLYNWCKYEKEIKYLKLYDSDTYDLIPNNIKKVTLVTITNKKKNILYIDYKINKSPIIDFEKLNNILSESNYHKLEISEEKYYNYNLSIVVPEQLLENYYLVYNNLEYIYYNTSLLYRYYKGAYNKFKDIIKKKEINDDNEVVTNIYNKFKLLFDDNQIKTTGFSFKPISRENKSKFKINNYIFNIFFNDNTIIKCKYDNDKNIIYNDNNKKLYFDKYELYDVNKLIDCENVFINNLLRYTKNIKDFFYIGLEDNNKSGIILFNKTINCEHTNIWVGSKVKRFDFPNDNKQFYYIEFINNNFNSIIPKLDNNYNEFLVFVTHLLVNWEYELFNLLLPYIIESDINSNKTYCRFILNNNYMPSPYRWYFLNKLYYILYGVYNKDIIHDLGIREYNYITRFSSFDISQHISDRPFKLSYYQEWIEAINKIQHNNMNTTDTTEIISKQYDKIKMVYDGFEIKLEDVLNQQNLMEYIIVNYDILTLKLQHDILLRIKSILNNSDLKNEEIIGNIKYFIQPTFQSNIKYESDIYEINRYIHLFCIITGKILNEKQYDLIYELFDDHATKQYKLYELLMGSGKTYLIIPCIVFILLMKKEYYNILICMPSHLINQSILIFREITPFFIDSYFFNININRNITDTIYFQSHIDNLTNKVIVVSDITIKSMLLNKKEFAINTKNCVLNDIINHNHNIHNVMKRNNAKLSEMPLNMLKNGSFIIFDEFDMLIDPLSSELNYPIGNFSKLDNQDRLCLLIADVCEHLFLQYKTFMSESDKQDNAFNKKLIKQIMMEICKQPDFNYLLPYIKNRETYEQFSPESLMTKNENEYFMIGGTHIALILYYLKITYDTFKGCLNMMINLHYGHDNNESKIVIPYLAQNTPMKGSQFSDPAIQMVLTYIYYLTENFRDTDSEEFIEYYKEHTSFIKEDPIMLEHIKISNHKKITIYMNTLKSQNYEKYMEYIRIYLLQIIFPKYIKINELYYNCSFIDIIDPDFIENKFALSGTVDVHLTTFLEEKYTISNIIENEDSKKDIDKALLSNNYIKNNINIIYQYNSPENILSFMIKIMEEYDVLIDVGSFLRHSDNYSVAFQLSVAHKVDVVYFDEDDEKKIFDTNTKMSIPFSNIKNKKIKVYFDQKHTIGSDIDLPSTSKSLLTINAKNTWTQVVQGLYRMREINYYQKNDYVVKDIHYTTPEEIIAHIKKNQEAYFKNTKNTFTKQSILCLLRKQLKYIKDSYLFEPFIPTFNISEKLFENLNHNYQNEQFQQYFYKKLNSDSSLHPSHQPNILRHLPQEQLPPSAQSAPLPPLPPPPAPSAQSAPLPPAPFPPLQQFNKGRRLLPPLPSFKKEQPLLQKVLSQLISFHREDITKLKQLIENLKVSQLKLYTLQQEHYQKLQTQLHDQNSLTQLRLLQQEHTHELQTQLLQIVKKLNKHNLQLKHRQQELLHDQDRHEQQLLYQQQENELKIIELPNLKKYYIEYDTLEGQTLNKMTQQEVEHEKKVEQIKIITKRGDLNTTYILKYGSSSYAYMYDKTLNIYRDLICFPSINDKYIKIDTKIFTNLYNIIYNKQYNYFYYDLYNNKILSTEDIIIMTQYNKNTDFCFLLTSQLEQFINLPQNIINRQPYILKYCICTMLVLNVPSTEMLEYLRNNMIYSNEELSVLNQLLKYYNNVYKYNIETTNPNFFDYLTYLLNSNSDKY